MFLPFRKPTTLITALLFALFCWFASSAAAISDEDLTELHSRLLSEDEMQEFHRELGFRRAWGDFKDSMRNTFRGGQGGMRGGGGGHGGHGTGGGGWGSNQQGPGFHGGGMGGDGGGGGMGLSPEEMAIVHSLLDNRDFIDRSKEMVKEDGQVVGMELLTTSDRPAVANKIKAHVRQMKALVKAGRWVRNRDPLYRELLSHRDELTMEVEYLTDGVLVTETGDSECTVALIQGHSEAVDGFIDRGRAEVHANHPVPSVCLEE